MAAQTGSPPKPPYNRQHDSTKTKPLGHVNAWNVLAIGIVVLTLPTGLWLTAGVETKALQILKNLSQTLGIYGLLTLLISYPAPTLNDRSSWTLTTDILNPNHYQSAPYVSNGYFGQTLPAEGVGYWVERKSDGSPALNGWPLDQPRATFGTIAGFWNLQEKVKYPTIPENVLRGGESVISGIPDWTGLVITTDHGFSYKPGVDPETVKQYEQGLSLSNGVVTTNVTWHPEGADHPLQLNFTVLAHHSRLTLGLVRLDITVQDSARFTLTDVLDGAGAVRTHLGDKGYVEDDATIWTSVKPWGVETTTAYVVSRARISGLTRREASTVADSRRDTTTAADIVSQNLSSVAQSWDVDIIGPGIRTISFTKYVGIASTDAFPNHAQATAFKTVVDASGVSWEELLNEHRMSWNSIWEDTGIEVPGDTELQTTVQASLFHLLSNTVPSGESQGDASANPVGMTDNSIPVGGLTSESYAGLVFWDSDVWMYPSLLALRPERARPILDYRSRLLPQAEANSRSYGRPGALYPWTSGRYGNCTGTGLCVIYQYHLNSDIAMAHWNYYLYRGDAAWLREKAWPIMKSVGDMFATYVSLDEKTGQYETKILAEPDEFAYNINNGAYTNAGIKMLLGEWAPQAAAVISSSEGADGVVTVPSNWSIIARDIKIPYDEESDIIVEFDGMDGGFQIKQASVTLMPYPLGWRLSEQQALNDMAYYAHSTTADGPAMTWAMYAVSALHLHPTGCAAYTYLLQASQPYLRGPYYQFSEQRTDSWTWKTAAGESSAAAAALEAHFGGSETSAAFPFLTGYGGYLQIFTHGFTGMRAEIDGSENDSGGNDAVLAVDPAMVPQLPEGLKIRGVKFRGAVLDFDIGLVNTTISRRHSPRFSTRGQQGPITIRVGRKGLTRRDFVLREGDQITTATRRPDRNWPAIPGNLAQCAPVSAHLSSSADSSSFPPLTPWVPGRHPVAAVDGSNDTVWQPLSPAADASIVIDLGDTKQVKGVVVNWASAPARQFAVEAQIGPLEIDAGGEDAGTKMWKWQEMFKTDSVTISAPYDPAKARRIAVPAGNVTVAAFKQEWDTRRVRFTIRGTQGVNQEVGATVAELGII